MLTEPGDGIAGVLVAELGARDALAAFLGDALAEPGHRIGIPTRELAAARARWLPRARAASVRGAIESAAHVRAQLVLPGDSVWPAPFADLGAHAPLCLWVRGDTAALVERGIAVVGARAASGYGEGVAMEFAAGIVARGYTVISGAAYGIDGAAHRAAISAGGRTVALLAGGVDRVYPAGHVELFERIRAQGALVSEVPCGGAPTKWRFLSRNRLIAALGAVTVVVEAGSRSGSLNTAGHAAALGRPLAAVPGPITSAASAGCHRLLREFDAACVTSAAEVLELAGDDALFGDDFAADAGTARGTRIDDATRVRDAMSARSERTSRDIAERAGLSIDDTEAILGLLLLEGGAARTDTGWRMVPAMTAPTR